MRRRALLAGIAGGISVAGCLSPENAPPSGQTKSPVPSDGTPTIVRRKADGIAATFEIVDSHRPADDAVHAAFDGQQVTVTGTMDPSGCYRPRFGAVHYSETDGVVNLRIGTESRYGPTPTVECGNASYDYRFVLAVDRGQPEAVQVLHDYRSGNDRSFVVEKGRTDG